MKFLKFAALAAALALSGCADLGSFVTSTTVSLTSSTPGQVKTLTEAVQSATLAEKAVSIYIKNGNPSGSVLVELRTLIASIHNTLLAAESANAKGDSAAVAAGLTAFNEALAAYNSYSTTEGITH